jgi:hypothetical protein
MNPADSARQWTRDAMLLSPNELLESEHLSKFWNSFLECVSVAENDTIMDLEAVLKRAMKSSEGHRLLAHTHHGKNVSFSLQYVIFSFPSFLNFSMIATNKKKKRDRNSQI